MYDDSLEIIERLLSLNPVYRDEVVEEVMEFLYEGRAK